MATTDEYKVLSPMDTEHKHMYDSFDFFTIQALPSTNTRSEPVYPLSPLYNTKWLTATSLVAGSTGGPPTSYASASPANKDGLETLADLFESVCFLSKT